MIQIPQSTIKPFGALGFPQALRSHTFNLNTMLRQVFNAFNSEERQRGYPLDSSKELGHFIYGIKHLLGSRGARDVEVSCYRSDCRIVFDVTYAVKDGTTHHFIGVLER